MFLLKLDKYKGNAGQSEFEERQTFNVGILLLMIAILLLRIESFVWDNLCVGKWRNIYKFFVLHEYLVPFEFSEILGLLVILRLSQD